MLNRDSNFTMVIKRKAFVHVLLSLLCYLGRTRRPQRPQRTRATSSSPDSIDVNWQDPDDESVDGYRVDVGTPSNPRSKFSQRIPRGTNSVSVPGLDEDSEYQVSVVSTSPTGESDPVRKSVRTRKYNSHA